MTIIAITEKQMTDMQTKIRANVARMLDFLYKCTGDPNDPNYDMPDTHIYEIYSILTHAVEEYGKLLYVKSLMPNLDNKYDVDYSNKFTSHKTKFRLALKDLPASIKAVYPNGFAICGFNKSGQTTAESTWNNRSDVLNVDLIKDGLQKGDPTEIEFVVDFDTLRKSIFEFRSYGLNYSSSS